MSSIKRHFLVSLATGRRRHRVDRIVQPSAFHVLLDIWRPCLGLWMCASELANNVLIL